MTPRYQQILGIRFFNGSVDDAAELLFQRGGFLVAPSGTRFARLPEDETYRRAVLAADLAIADSGLMVSPVKIVLLNAGAGACMQEQKIASPHSRYINTSTRDINVGISFED